MCGKYKILRESYGNPTVTRDRHPGTNSHSVSGPRDLVLHAVLRTWYLFVSVVVDTTRGEERATPARYLYANDLFAQKNDTTMTELEQQFAALDVIDTLRRSKRMTLPDAGLVIGFEKLATKLMRRTSVGSSKLRDRRMNQSSLSLERRQVVADSNKLCPAPVRERTTPCRMSIPCYRRILYFP